jgi:hypothetical protein
MLTPGPRPFRALCLQELLSGSSDASSSLMRQIQALAEQASAAQASAAEQEQQLLGRLRAAEQAAADATAAERDAAGRAASAEAALEASREAAAGAVQVRGIAHAGRVRISSGGPSLWHVYRAVPHRMVCDTFSLCST